MNYTLNTIVENNTTRYLLCDSQQNYYTINKLLHDILFEYKTTNNIDEICENLNRHRKDNFLTPNYIEQSLAKAEEVFLKNEPTIAANKKYIKYQTALIKEGRFKKTYRLLSFLFNKYIFFYLTLISFVTSIIFFYENGLLNLSSLYNRLISASTFGNLAICFILSILIILIHEIGHAAAAFKYKIQPKEIGVGLYFIFPVLYTNVTNIWSLPAKKRLVVNVGGIYFQLLINLLLILFYYLGFLKNITLLLLAFNSISMLVSFNPFFRYDGYWLYSDFFGIPNLREKSTEIMTNAISNPTKIKNYLAHNRITFSAIAYSILNICFWTFTYYSIISYLIKNIPKSISLIFVRNEFTLQSFSTIFTCILIFIGMSIAIKNISLNLLKHKSHAKQ